MTTEATRLDTRYLDRPYVVAGRAIDPLGGTVSWKGESQALRRKQLEVLAWLASAGTEMVSRTAFIDGIWAGNALVGEAALTDTLSSLRRVLHDTDPDQPLIRTIPRRGYQLMTQARLDNAQTPLYLVAGGPVPGRPDWLLVRLLAQSAVSETWLARQQGGQTDHVFRFCSDEEYLRLLQREVTLLRYLRETLANRRDTATIIDWRLDEPPYFLELDYATLGSLAEWSAAQGGLKQTPLAQRLGWMAQAAAALSAVHAAGIVHRQLSAAAVLLDGSADDPHAKLGEFGLGELKDRSRLEAFKITAAGLTLSGEEPAGPQCYLAPERLGGSTATAASDVYALGVLLYQMVVADLSRPLRPDWEDEVDSETLRQLITSCTAAQSEARPSAQTVAELLRRFEPDAATNQSDDRATRQISSADIPAATPAEAPEARSTEGKHIGPYRILESLGDGGMGSVYLAEQRTPVQRLVALKVVKTGMDSGQVLARFEAERQALALMNHVNVAAVYDADTTESGQPYFAMEYVPGLDITTHCDKLELDFRQRIELFLQVCDGVLHAHQKGLIHRDLKPGNILVKRPQGQVSTVKIIDFGVAKSLQGRLSAHTLHTRHGSYVGTPVYSSPEQILGHQASIDTRADTYSLGVVLYELLAGVTPYSDEDLADKSPPELARLLSHSDAPSLVTRFASLDPEDEAEIARHRRMSIERMLESLGADVSWIVGKCLERDPDDRYASVLELKKDLQRWLENRPVEARPATRLYRLRKLVRRNRTTVTVAALVTLALLGTTAAAVIGFVRAERALAAAHAAMLEADMAADFQSKQMQSIDPAAMGGGLRKQLIVAVELRGKERGWTPAAVEEGQRQLDRLIEGMNFTDLSLNQLDDNIFKPALAVIEEKYADHPALQARLWQAIADSLLELGRYQEAMIPQQMAVDQRLRILGPRNRNTLSSIRKLGHLKVRLGQLEQGEVDLRAALSGMRESLGNEDPLTLESMSRLGDLLTLSGELDEAESLFREALAGQRRILGPDDSETLQSLNSLGGLMIDRGRLDEAQALIGEALDSRRRVFGDSHRDTLNSLNDMGIALAVMGKPLEAEAPMREAMEGYRQLFGEDHPDTIQITANLAAQLRRMGRLDEAEVYTRKVLVTRRQVLGETNRSTLNAINTLGVTLTLQGRLDEAESYLRDAWTKRRSALGDENAASLESGFGLAVVLQQQGRLDEAEKLQRDVLEIQRRVLGEDRPETLRSMSQLAVILTARGKLDEAETLVHKALTEQRRALGDDDPETLTSLSILTQLLRQRGQLDAALAAGTELLERARRVFNPGHYQLGVYLANHGRTLLAMARYGEAKQLFDEAWSNLNQSGSGGQPHLAELAGSFVELYNRWHQSTQAGSDEAQASHWRRILDELERTAR